MSPGEAFGRAIAPFADELAHLRPGGAHVIDAHTHLGLDEDGMSLDPAGLEEMLDQADAKQAIVFPLHDPERRPSYRVPNDRVLEWARESNGRFVPFCRLDPADGPLAEAERCLAAGARGIKLHPRAQEFDLVGHVEPIFDLAEQAGVPILIHAGRGLPPTFGSQLVRVAQLHPGAPLILAHLGVADLAILADGLADHPAATFDSSWLNPVDTFGLLSRVPAQRVVFGTDPPYGRTLVGMYLLLRVAASLGLDAETARDMLGRTVQRLLDGEALPAPAPPSGTDQLVLDTRLARLTTICLMAFSAAIAGSPAVAVGQLQLAQAVCRDPQPGEAGAAIDRIVPLLETAAELIHLETGGVARPALQLLIIAVAIAATEVPQPSPGAVVSQ
jgi:predicted TIM-barrel fold metal-dependent hydrolase